MSPEYVQPYVKAQKNDERDAEAIAEAATRPTMRRVELKSEAQLDMQILHRARTRLVTDRTALINQLRALLLERGIIVAQGRQRLEKHLVFMLDDGAVAPSTLSPRTLLLIADMRQEWRELDRRIAALTAEFMVHGSGSRRSGCPTPRHDPRLRRPQCHGSCGRDRHGRDLPSRPGFGGLARLGPTPIDNGRQTPPARNHQARERLPAYLADPWSTGGAAVTLDEPNADERMAAQPDRSHHDLVLVRP